MYAFTLERPATLQDAAKLAAAGSKPLAGGQTLLASMKLRLSSPEKLADLSGIKDMNSIKRDGNSVVIGAMARHADVAVHADVMAAIPALAHLAGNIGDRQVRAMGTMGGSVANNDPSACYPSAVLALGATIHTTARKIEAKDYFQGMFTTALGMGELITKVVFPVPEKSNYEKFRNPASRYAMVGVFVARGPAGVRVAITGAGQGGVFRHAAMEAALGATWSADAVKDIVTPADGLNGDIHASPEYRAHLIGVMAKRAVAGA